MGHARTRRQPLPVANVHAKSEDEDKPKTQLSIPLTEIPEAEAPDIPIILKTDSARGYQYSSQLGVENTTGVSPLPTAETERLRNCLEFAPEF